MNYIDFLNSKKRRFAGKGKEISESDIHPLLFDFQKKVTAWAVKKGRCALFLDTGLGKTFCQLEWARLLNEPTVIIAPLSVARQTVREAKKIDLEIKYIRSHSEIDKSIPIHITNYEMIDAVTDPYWQAIVLDESSILKSFDGKTRLKLIKLFQNVPYRLACTATPAPNDQVELGNHTEFLGICSQNEMLSEFFIHANLVVEKHYDNGIVIREKQSNKKGTEWRLRNYGKKDFYSWMSSWAMSIRKPSDLGFDDNDFILPDLIVNEIIVRASRPLKGRFFITPAITLDEQRMERRATIMPRCEMVAEKVNGDFPAVVWCHLNDEANLLEKIIPDAVQVSGSDSDEIKEKIFLDFVDGNIRVLITKPKIGAFGLNWQHCSNMTFFPSHSFEQYYQGTRRCWRFGQKNKVKVDIITTEGETGVLMNLQRKMEAAEKMFSQLILEMNKELRMQRTEKYEMKVRTPEWL